MSTCDAADHEWHVSGEAYTNCCEGYIPRGSLQTLLGRMDGAMRAGNLVVVCARCWMPFAVPGSVERVVSAPAYCERAECRPMVERL